MKITSVRTPNALDPDKLLVRVKISFYAAALLAPCPFSKRQADPGYEPVSGKPTGEMNLSSSAYIEA